MGNETFYGDGLIVVEFFGLQLLRDNVTTENLRTKNNKEIKG